MVAQLRKKPGGDDIPVTIGDFSEVPVSGTYRLVYIVFNTFFNLLEQAEQVRCFENVAAHLADDGAFVIEALLPAHVHALPENQYVHAEEVGVDEVWLDVASYDPVTQRLDETHVRLREGGGVGLFPIVTRYCYPSELDLMARIAGLRLRERWGGWNRDPFTRAASSRCRSTGGRAAQPLASGRSVSHRDICHGAPGRPPTARMDVPSAVARALRMSAGSRTNTSVPAGASTVSPSTVKTACPLITANSSSWPSVRLSSSSRSWWGSTISSPAFPVIPFTPNDRMSKWRRTR